MAVVIILRAVVRFIEIPPQKTEFYCELIRRVGAVKIGYNVVCGLIPAYPISIIPFGKSLSRVAS